MGELTEHTEELDGRPVSWRSAPVAAGGDPILYLHGVPNASHMWDAFLCATGGIAVDLPGFGRSFKRGDFDYTIDGYADFVERFLQHLGIERFALVTHDWGTPLGLAAAQRRPDRVTRLVIVDGVPLLPGYRWHTLARAWRTPVLGELIMGFTNRFTLRALARRASPHDRVRADAFADDVLEHFDQGTQRAILKLYRGAPESLLAAAGARLATLACPALVIWGDRDPYIPPAFADAYGRVLPDATVEHFAEAGHWPWTEQPAVVERVAGFLAPA